MALTLTKITDMPGPVPFGDRWITVRKVAFDSSYPTGGESLTTSELGFSKAPDWVEIEPKNGYVFEYDATNQKIKAFQGDNANAAAAPLVEVANTTNLAAVTDVIVKAFGRFAG